MDTAHPATEVRGSLASVAGRLRALMVAGSAAAVARAGGGAWPPALAAHMGETVRDTELAGLTFALKARSLAAGAVGCWLLASVGWPRNLYYFGLAMTFMALGYIPYRLRDRPAEAVRLAFVVLDSILVTAAILVPQPSPSIG